MKNVSLLSCHRERQLYRRESLLPPGHVVTRQNYTIYSWNDGKQEPDKMKKTVSLVSRGGGGVEFLSIRTANRQHGRE